MKTKTIKLYGFDELKPEIQEKVLEKFRSQEGFEFLTDDLNQLLKDTLERKKIKKYLNLKLGYSLSHCQGDGVNFAGVLWWGKYIIRIEKTSSMYEHKHTTSFYIYSDDKNGLEKEASIKVYNKFKELYYSICDEIEKAGYDIIEDTLRDESIIDLIKANEYTFRENGTIENL